MYLALLVQYNIVENGVPAAAATRETDKERLAYQAIFIRMHRTIADHPRRPGSLSSTVPVYRRHPDRVVLRVLVPPLVMTSAELSCLRPSRNSRRQWTPCPTHPSCSTRRFVKTVSVILILWLIIVKPFLHHTMAVVTSIGARAKKVFHVVLLLQVLCVVRVTATDSLLDEPSCIDDLKLKCANTATTTAQELDILECVQLYEVIIFLTR